MRISKEIIDAVVQRTDIVGLIGEYISLKKVGSNYKALCPFHSEKTPSFSVSEKGFFHCFGCNEGGNAISFLQKYLNLSFVEAVSELAKRCGINIDLQEFEQSEESEIRDLYNIAQEFYSMLLVQNSGVEALDYFKQRNLSMETIKEFSLGYSSNKWDALFREFMRRGISTELVVKSGLVVNKNNKFYDFFRNRAMFPIKDYLGRTIAFGGRQIDGNKSSPKYINSSDTVIYDKKRTLFGIAEAKNSIRKTDEVFIVEGYLDVLSLSQAGIKNVVAPCGTALTKEQLIYLKKHTNVNVLYFLFDGDLAGTNAALRGIPAALEVGFDLRIIKLPEGQDPDTLINLEGGYDEFMYHKNHACSFVDFICDRKRNENKLETPAEKSETIQEIIKLIFLIKDKTQHLFYLENIKEIFNMPIEILKNIYRDLLRNNAKPKASNKEENNEVSTKDVFFDVEKLFPEEKTIFKFILKNKQNFKTIKEDYRVAENSFITDIAKSIFEIINEFWDAEDVVQELMKEEDRDEELIQLLLKLKMEEFSQSAKWKEFTEIETKVNTEQVVGVALARLRVKAIEIELKELQQKLKVGDMQGLQQINCLQKEKQDIINTDLRYE